MDQKSYSKRTLSPAQTEREQRSAEADRALHISQTENIASVTEPVDDLRITAQEQDSPRYRRHGLISSDSHGLSKIIPLNGLRNTDHGAEHQVSFEETQGDNDNPGYERHEVGIAKLKSPETFKASQQSAIVEINKANKLRAASERERDGWRMRAKEIADELADCQDNLFSLQPRDTATDTQVGEEWNTLCQQIARWVDDEIDIMNDPLIHLQQLVHDGLLPKEARTYWSEEIRVLIERYSMEDDFDWLLRHNIHCLLETRIFDESIYFFGLPKSEASMFARVEKAFKNLKPQREQVNIDHWRSEGLSAISTEPEIAKLRDNAAVWVTNDAAVMIMVVVPSLSHKAMENFHSNITIPAIGLASTIRRSLKQYRFDFGFEQDSGQSKWHTLVSSQKTGVPIYQNDIDGIEMFDIRSRRKIKSTRPLIINGKNQVGEQVLLLHPALYRCKGDVKVKCIIKATLVIDLLKPTAGKKLVVADFRQIE